MKGVAIHVVPESCVDTRKGIGEALTGADAGRAIEPPKYRVRKADYAPLAVLCRTPIIGEPIKETLEAYVEWFADLLRGP